MSVLNCGVVTPLTSRPKICVLTQKALISGYSCNTNANIKNENPRPENNNFLLYENIKPNPSTTTRAVTNGWKNPLYTIEFDATFT